MGLRGFFKKPKQISTETDHTEQLKRKAEFFKNIQPYYDAGLVRDVYVSDHVCILAFGEVAYIACQYNFLDGEPFGLYVTQNIIKKLIEKNRMIYPFVNEAISNIELLKKMLYNLPASKIPVWREWIKENLNKSLIDPEFEKEIQKTEWR